MGQNDFTFYSITNYFVMHMQSITPNIYTMHRRYMYRDYQFFMPYRHFINEVDDDSELTTKLSRMWKLNRRFYSMIVLTTNVVAPYLSFVYSNLSGRIIFLKLVAVKSS